MCNIWDVIDVKTLDCTMLNYNFLPNFTAVEFKVTFRI